jgi:hypothetical protein
MSKILPEQCNFIAIGAWNPAIIQPQWLKKQFGEKIPDQCNVEIVAMGAVSAFRLSFEKFIIDPNNGRLVLIPKDGSEATFSYLAELALGIQEKLPHTPILAAGSNFVFKLDDGETFLINKQNKDADVTNFYHDINDKAKIVSKSTRHTLGLETCSINITYEYSTEKIIRINFDYQKYDAMKRAATSLVDNYKYAVELSGRLVEK